MPSCLLSVANDKRDCYLVKPAYVKCRTTRLVLYLVLSKRMNFIHLTQICSSDYVLCLGLEFYY